MASHHFEVPGENRDRYMHQQMAAMTRNAEAVLFGDGVVDDQLFPPVPHSTAAGDYEAGRIIPERNNVTYAFSGAWYAEGYGPASELSRLAINHGDSVGKTLGRWDALLSKSYERVVSERTFRRAYVERGLAQVFLDPAIPELDEVRQALNHHDEQPQAFLDEMRQLAQEARKVHFERPSYPHVVSHVDAARFANTVLYIGHREMGIAEPDDSTALLERSLPELKRIAMLSIGEFDAISPGLVDPRDERLLKRELVAIDPVTEAVVFADEPIVDLIVAKQPEAGEMKRRGCPVLFQKTQFGGAEVPVFQAMNETLIRIYNETGALERPSLRRITK